MPLFASSDSESVPLTRILLGTEGKESSLERHLLLAIPMLLLGVLFTVMYPELLSHGAFVAGYAVLLLSLIFAAVFPWDRFRANPSVVLALLGFVAIILARIGSLTVLDVMGLLAVFPMTRLAVSIKYRGVAIGMGATILMMIAPLLLGLTPLSSQVVARLAALPLVIFFVGLAVAFITSRLEGQSQTLLRTSQQLASALAQSQEREELLRSVLSAIDVGVVAMDASGVPSVVNKRGFREDMAISAELREAGAAREKWFAMGEGSKELFEPDKVTPIPAERRPLARAIRGEEYSNMLFWERREGRVTAYSATARPIRMATTTPDAIPAASAAAGHVVAFANVTQLLDSANAQQEFVATISHELRTPLTSILGYTEMLRDELTDAGMTDVPSLKVIERNATKLRDRVSDLVSSAESTLSIVPVPTDLRSCIDAAISAIEPLATIHRAALRTEAPECVVALADPQRVGQILENIISNAVKYSPSTTVTVVLGRDASAHQAVVKVIDHGVGISAEDQQKVFSRFFRSNSARESQVSGFGLGLNIAKSLTERHGGTLELDSELGVGTTITLRLPMAGSEPSDNS
ncbi:sensor histidine kinase [Pseudarthrobacter sp. J1763]|uniref:sensor histidine kinase n=1 Tax=Pseudarthrobacter sp. J1763 TaxID=3420445 RepID=UPI003D2990A9